jgi:hypothetical protein
MLINFPILEEMKEGTMGRRVITSKDIKKYEAVAAAESAAAAAAALEDPTKAMPEKATEIPKADDYLEQVVKYIPTEIVAGFIAISGITKAITDVPLAVQWVIFGVLLILTPLYTWRVSTDPKIGISVSQLVIATVAFLLWVFTLGGPFSTLSWYMPYYGAIASVLFTLFIPVIIGR